MYYEFRFYAVAPGRLTDEMALVRRVSADPAPDLDDAEGPSLWDRYGVPRPVGSWITLTGRNRPGFLYIVPWQTLAQRDACRNSAVSFAAGGHVVPPLLRRRMTGTEPCGTRKARELLVQAKHATDGFTHFVFPCQHENDRT